MSSRRARSLRRPSRRGRRSMNAPSAAPAGVQRPRVRVAPRVKRSDADDAEFLAASYGLTPDEWQRLVLEDWLAVRADGRWATLKCGLAVPRQNRSEERRVGKECRARGAREHGKRKSRHGAW